VFKAGDMKNGKGSCGGEHGDMYEGEWKDNKRHGVGTNPFLSLLSPGSSSPISSPPHVQGRDSCKTADATTASGKTTCARALAFFGGQSTTPRTEVCLSFITMRAPVCAVVRVRCVRSGRASAVLIEGGVDAGDLYAGNWKEDQRHGEGIYIWADGTKYEGQWKEGKREGFGSVVWPDGRRFAPPPVLSFTYSASTWLSHTFLACHRYEGEYKDGKMSGKGTFCWPDGSVYVGEYKVHFLFFTQLILQFTKYGQICLLIFFELLTRVATGWQEARRGHVHVQHNDGWSLHGPVAERNAGRLGQARQERWRDVSGAVQ
jgi:hypothetical protein